jgi:hypothetical protein
MTREEVIAFGKRKYGERWIGRLAEATNYSVSALSRVVSGEVPVTRRLELEMKRLVREHQYEALSKPEVRYE